MNYTNGDMYEGQWKDDTITGHGTFIWRNGKKYVGDFKNGLRHGLGKLYYAPGGLEDNSESGHWVMIKYDIYEFVYYESYEGDWIDDKREGHGTLLLTNGSKYIGLWANDNKHGYGTEFDPHGIVLREGLWQSGYYVKDSPFYLGNGCCMLLI